MMNAHTKKLLALVGLTSACFSVSEEAVAQKSATLKKKMTINKNMKISPQAMERMRILKEGQIDKSILIKNAKETIYNNNGYSDFFVESGGGSWHEAFTDVITGNRLTSPTKRHLAKSPARLELIKIAGQDDGYADFFVDGTSPWHEAVKNTGNLTKLIKNPALRAKNLKQLRVMKAFDQMKMKEKGINRNQMKMNRKMINKNQMKMNR